MSTRLHSDNLRQNTCIVSFYREEVLQTTVSQLRRERETPQSVINQERLSKTHSKLMIQNSLSILTVLDGQASVRCTQFLLIQGFWSCFVPQIVDIVWKIQLVLHLCGSCVVFSCVCACLCMCSSMYIVHGRRKTVARQRLFSLNLFSFTNCFFYRQSSAWRESQKSIQH